MEDLQKAEIKQDQTDKETTVHYMNPQHLERLRSQVQKALIHQGGDNWSVNNDNN